MSEGFFESENPIIEVMALPKLIEAMLPDTDFYAYVKKCTDAEFQGKVAKTCWNALTELSAVVVACTSYDARYSALASTRFLLLDFDDITNRQRQRSFKRAHAQEIAKFLEAAYGSGADVKRIIAACDGGMSRSAAVAAALMYRFGQDDETSIWLNPVYRPNPLVFELLCEGLGSGMPKAAVDERVRRSERAWILAYKS